jgi:hypothetical protein
LEEEERRRKRKKEKGKENRKNEKEKKERKRGERVRKIRKNLGKIRRDFWWHFPRVRALAGLTRCRATPGVGGEAGERVGQRGHGWPGILSEVADRGTVAVVCDMTQ